MKKGKKFTLLTLYFSWLSSRVSVILDNSFSEVLDIRIGANLLLKIHNTIKYISPVLKMCIYF